ncbi:MAG: hypothetical protein K2G26_04150, partial [Clostridia bacterium]|nr:hypothetical protein [Clostridia bacterium]
VVYNGQSQSIAISGTLPDGVTVKYYVGEEEFTGAMDVGDYDIVAKFTGSDDYAPIPEKKATLKITQAEYDMSGVKFEDKKITYTGEAFDPTGWIDTTTLPKGREVSYSCDTDMIEVNESGYTVTATFTNPDTKNYKDPATMTAKLIISNAFVEGIKAEIETKEYTTANTLEDLKAKLTVTAVFNNGATEEVEEYELTCNGLRDGGKFKAGNQSVTVTYKVGDDVFTAVVNNILVSREKVALPVYNGGLKYTGVSIKPTVDNFNGYDETLMTFVVDKTVSGLAVGSYKAVFALNDLENYEWATATTLKKSVFAVALYDEEITLLASEAAVDWNIAKAVLTATKTDGGLPVFASESYIGAFSDIVTLKYYADEACTEEIAADKLAYSTDYYVKAELLDTENFELDSSAAQYTVKSFTYTTPAKALTTWDKVVIFLKANWWWIVIAVVALILLITIIACAVRASKKKREREERRLAEEKEEKKREQE